MTTKQKSDVNKVVENLFSEFERFLNNKSMKELMETGKLNEGMNKVKKSIVVYLKKEMESISTYQLQKNGIDSKTYSILKNNPESMKIETLINLNNKIIKIKQTA